ncbi:MAG TPA: hypothetical protein VF522_21830 [Ramlibacter sp.]|uniref:hypothetical protein n=1 Tax=Ramlibacter sp. TaxID=1917967 RepID=UPI002ED1FCD7
MNKTSISRVLLLSGVLAAAGVAQAQVPDQPEQPGQPSLSVSGADQQTPMTEAANGSVWIDTTVLGAPPAVLVAPPSSETIVTTTTYMGPVVTWTQPMLPHHYTYTLPAPVLSSPDTVTIQNY